VQPSSLGYLINKQVSKILLLDDKGWSIAADAVLCTCVDSKENVWPPACTDNRPSSHSGSSMLEENSRCAIPSLTIHCLQYCCRLSFFVFLLACVGAKYSFVLCHTVLWQLNSFAWCQIVHSAVLSFRNERKAVVVLMQFILYVKLLSIILLVAV